MCTYIGERAKSGNYELFQSQAEIWKTVALCLTEEVSCVAESDEVWYNNLFAFPFEIRLQEIHIYIFFFLW